MNIEQEKMIVESLPSLYPMMQEFEEDAIHTVLDALPHWIPCEERLPKVSGCYLVSVKNDHERRYSKTAWFEKCAWFARQDVVAWMPLPEPYKEVKE